MRLPPSSSPFLELHRFLMRVPKGGYRWVDDFDLIPFPNGPIIHEEIDPAEAPFLVEEEPAEPARVYEPLVETPDLFRKFRDLKRDRESILRFANEYGWIGGQGLIYVVSKTEVLAGLNEGQKKPEPTRHTAHVVSFGRWKSEIEDMVIVDRLVTLAQQKDNRTLSQYFSWHPEEFNVEIHFEVDGAQLRRSRRLPSVPGHWLKGGGVMSGYRDLVKEGWKRGDYIRVALAFVECYVNERVSLLCYPVLQRDRRGRLTGYLTSRNLLGCIWLQFYLMAIGNLKLRRCVVCGQEMDVTERRSSRQMHTRCSRNKRQAAWRAKQRPETQKD